MSLMIAIFYSKSNAVCLCLLLIIHSNTFVHSRLQSSLRYYSCSIDMRALTGDNELQWNVGPFTVVNGSISHSVVAAARLNYLQPAILTGDMRALTGDSVKHFTLWIEATTNRLRAVPWLRMVRINRVFLCTAGWKCGPCSPKVHVNRVRVIHQQLYIIPRTSGRAKKTCPC